MGNPMMVNVGDLVSQFQNENKKRVIRRNIDTLNNSVNQPKFDYGKHFNGSKTTKHIRMTSFDYP